MVRREGPEAGPKQGNGVGSSYFRQVIHCRMSGGEYRQMFEAVPENGSQFIPEGVHRFMGTTTLIMQTEDGRQFPREHRFPIQAATLREAWGKFTSAETESVARLMAPSIKQIITD